MTSKPNVLQSFDDTSRHCFCAVCVCEFPGIQTIRTGGTVVGANDILGVGMTPEGAPEGMTDRDDRLRDGRLRDGLG